MKHILMGLRLILFGILSAVCLGILATAIIVLKELCGAPVAIGVTIALVLFAMGFNHSINGG
jgi:hypothetical protein